MWWWGKGGREGEGGREREGEGGGKREGEGRDGVRGAPWLGEH